LSSLKKYDDIGANNQVLAEIFFGSPCSSDHVFTRCWY